jgi:hypothetical protein
MFGHAAARVGLTLLLAVAHGSAGFDAWSTRRATRNPAAREVNPLVRPFARSHAAYLATQGDIIVPELLIPKLPRKWRWVGYAWIAGAAGVHIGLGVSNLNVPPAGAPVPPGIIPPAPGFSLFPRKPGSR